MAFLELYTEVRGKLFVSHHSTHNVYLMFVYKHIWKLCYGYCQLQGRS